jgi:acyl dehydratase
VTVVDTEASLRVYDWDHARPGDAADPAVVRITPEQVRAYLRAMGRPDAVATHVPAVMVRLFAPLRRRELVARVGAAYPSYQTPAVRWQCRFLDEVRIGEAVVSTTRVVDKYERSGRRYLQWEVAAQRESDGLPLAVFGYVNLWEPGRPEDRHRGGGQTTPAAAASASGAVRAAGDAAPPASVRTATRTWTAGMQEILAFGDVLYPPRPDNPTRAGNPHVDAEFARKHLYGGITVDGNQTVAFLCELVEALLPGAAVHGPGSQVDIRFPNPCRQDDVVTFTATQQGEAAHTGDPVAVVEVDARNQPGHCVARGTITVRLPDVA